ncbi:cytochrome c oxidase assembly factor 3 homolog, mitochondrial-like [Girardinichthys multiradiatus]|uniref:cytochrome c oxidase assembly factor 3 homolog, mitochondrial-like n=1 Tax=Girardinichthys multiradiatus TaxID=208333 RepID=UPI001FAD52C9|nr:cytochrome c oxidase assembly factor 3 homolog, mitochondrial-like [Girardinichthys multiradiatus]
MAEEGSGTGAKASPTAVEMQLHRRRQELEHFRINAARIRSRNLLTGLGIGAFVVGIFSYTILSVKQERIVGELDEEARIHIIRGPRTGANS